MTTPDTKLPIVAWANPSRPSTDWPSSAFAWHRYGNFIVPLTDHGTAQAAIDALTEELRLSRMTEAAAWLRVTEMQSEIDRLRAENFKLSAAMCPLGFGDEGGTPRCCAEAELAALRKGAERYQWLRSRLPGSAYRIAGVIYSEGGAGVDAAIDAARAAIASKQDTKS